MATSTAQISKVLHEVGQKPADTTTAKMFLEALPHIFGGERHDYQIRLATMLRETLKHALEQQTGGKNSVAVSLEEAQATLDKLLQEKHAAEGIQEKANTLVGEKDKILCEMRQLTKTETQRHRDTILANESVEKEHLELEESKTGIDSIVNGSLSMLLQENLDSEEARDDFVKPVTDYLETMGCDKVLLAALPRALGCCPAKRGEFANVVFDEVVKRLNDKAASISALLKDSGSRFEEAKAERLGAWAIADVARDEENAAEQAKKAADDDLQNAAIHVEIISQKVSTSQTKMERIAAEQALIEEKIKGVEAALGEMDQLELGLLEVDKENADIVSPAAKRRKLSVEDTCLAMQEETAAISVN